MSTCIFNALSELHAAILLGLFGVFLIEFSKGGKSKYVEKL